MGLLTVHTVKKIEFPKYKMADGRHFEKTVKFPYLSNRFTDFNEIWHGGAIWPPAGDSYNFEFFKNQYGGGHRLETSQKSRYLRNGFTDLYEIWYASAKWFSYPSRPLKTEFHKFKMADGRHYAHVMAYQPTLLFQINTGSNFVAIAHRFTYRFSCNTSGHRTYYAH